MPGGEWLVQAIPGPTGGSLPSLEGDMTPAPDTLADQATGGGPRPHRTRAGPYRHPPDAQLAPQAVETHDGRIPLGASRGFGVWWREGVGPPGRASFDEEYPPMPARAATPRPSRIRCPTAPLRKRPTRRPHPGTFGASFRGGRPGPLEMSRFCLDTSGSSHFQRGDPEVVELIDERSERPRNVDPGLRSARTSRTTLMSRKRRIRSASLPGGAGSPPRRYRWGCCNGGLARIWPDSSSLIVSVLWALLACGADRGDGGVAGGVRRGLNQVVLALPRRRVLRCVATGRVSLPESASS